MMVRALILSAVAAGLAAGLALALFQAVAVTPLILEAELHEQGAVIGTHGHEAVAALDLARYGLTSLATIITAAGAAMILLGLMVLDGGPVDARRALCWGACAFVATALAPALGLPPELPGMASGALESRQVWWLATAGATALGLWLILRLGGWAWTLAALLLLIAPHLLRVPHGAAPETTVPPGLAAAFVAASLAGSALFWALVSSTAGFSFARLYGGRA